MKWTRRRRQTAIGGEKRKKERELTEEHGAISLQEHIFYLDLIACESGDNSGVETREKLLTAYYWLSKCV